MLLSLTAVMLCMTAFSIPAYAGGAEPAEQPETEQPQETAPPLTLCLSHRREI